MTDEEYIQLGKLVSKAINELKKTSAVNSACPFCRQIPGYSPISPKPYWLEPGEVTITMFKNP